MVDSHFLFVLLALSFSAFIKGSLGLGFSTICLAMLANVIELKTAISIVVLPSLLSNLIVMLQAGHLRISLRRFYLLIACALPGMFLGLQVLRLEDNAFSIQVLGSVLIIYGVWGWFNHRFTINQTLEKRLNPAVGIFTGVVNGATGSQIFPIMPYLLSLNISKDVLVQTINLSFTLNSLVMLGFLISIDRLDSSSTLTYSLGILPVTIGVWLGGKVRKRIPEQGFKRMVMLLIMTLGALLLSR